MTTNTPSASRACDDGDEYPEITQADLDRAAFRIGLRPARRRKRISNSSDANLAECFESRGSKRAYRTLIDETLRRTGE